MKTLTLIRHAKSSWEQPLHDRDRPLKKRGFKDAELVSNALLDRILIPEIIFSSPANRALSTCNIFINTLNLNDKTLKIREDLYDFGGDSVIKFLKGIPQDYKNVMIFGHNHAFTSICNIFGDKFIDNLPTSGLVVIDFDVLSWSDIKHGTTRFTIFPRDLK